MISKIQFITNPYSSTSHVEQVKMACEAGCNWIQVRIKDFPETHIETIAKECLSICQFYGVTFILNDYPHIALKIGADGVHLGKKDMPIEEARAFLGQSMLIGGTANTLEDVLYLANHANYIGLGPFRETSTKKELSPVLGLSGYTEILNKLPQGFRTPIVAIGGIQVTDVSKLVKSGVFGIAFSSLLEQSDNKINLIKTLEEELNNEYYIKNRR